MVSLSPETPKISAETQKKYPRHKTTGPWPKKNSAEVQGSLITHCEESFGEDDLPKSIHFIEIYIMGSVISLKEPILLSLAN